VKKRFKTRVICLIVAGMVLTGSLALSAANGSPYETLRNAVFNAMSYENVTIQGHMTVFRNGEVYQTERVHMVIGDYATLEKLFCWRTGEPMGGYAYNSDILSIRPYNFDDPDGLQWYTAHTFRASWHRTQFSTGPFGLTDDMRGTATFRLYELALDLMVGDLKNNLSMTRSGGLRHVTGAITHNQLPEFFRVLLDVVAESTQNPWSHNPIQNIHLDRVSGNASIDADGNLVYFSINGQVTTTSTSGQREAWGLEVEMHFSDIGTSNPQVTFVEAYHLFSPDVLYRQFGRRYMTVYFTHDADGTINQNSITTQWPGERGRGR
jgi:hypothetical protein